MITITINFKKKSNEFIIFHSLFRWRQWLRKKKKDDEVHIDKSTLVGITQLVSVFKRNTF